MAEDGAGVDALDGEKVPCQSEVLLDDIVNRLLVFNVAQPCENENSASGLRPVVVFSIQ